MYNITCCPFQDLSLQTLYDIMVLRQEIFVVEQNCVFIDADGKDQGSWHYCMRNNEGKLVAYTRLLPEGLAYEGYTSIGRVVNSASVRGTGIGKVLMQGSIDKITELWGSQNAIKIGAQTYLLGFYESLGFVNTGEAYIEDGIPHTHMILENNIQ
jgi:ElaA protein